MKVKFVATVAALLATAGVSLGQGSKADHLVLSEMLINSPGAESVGDILEYIEVYNPTDSAIDLHDYFLTDVADYWLLPAYIKEFPSGKLDTGLIPNGQHILQFPEGSSIPAGGVVVVTWVANRFINDFFEGDLNNFTNLPGNPQLFETLPATVVPDMITYKASEDPSTGQEYSISKANGSDMIIMFKWDGQADLVTDVDMVTYGGNAGPTPKTGVAVEGPDPDTMALTYNNEPSEFPNLDMEQPGAPDPDAIYRTTLLEPGEVRTGGNGINGHAEVTEVTRYSWAANEPAQTVPPLTPGTTDLPLASVNEVPVVYDASRTDRYPAPGSPLQITAKVADDGLSPVTVQVKVIVNGTTQTVNMTPTATQDQYTANIGPYTNKTEVTYYIVATDAAGTTVFPQGADTNPTLLKIFLVDNDLVTDTDVLINEIYYDVAGAGEEGEFVELHNRTAINQPVGGFVIRDAAGNFAQLPPGAIIPAGGYLVLTNNIEALNAKYSQPVPNLFQGSTGYNNGGDTLWLLHVNDYTVDGLETGPIDTVDFTAEAPWPTDGNGAPSPKTNELKLPTLDNNVGSNWAASIPDNGTPGYLNSTQWPANVSNWTLY